jgi:hypothetical protein
VRQSLLKPPDTLHSRNPRNLCVIRYPISSTARIPSITVRRLVREHSTSNPSILQPCRWPKTIPGCDFPSDKPRIYECVTDILEASFESISSIYSRLHIRISTVGLTPSTLDPALPYNWLSSCPSPKDQTSHFPPSQVPHVSGSPSLAKLFGYNIHLWKHNRRHHVL